MCVPVHSEGVDMIACSILHCDKYFFSCFFTGNGLDGYQISRALRVAVVAILSVNHWRV